MKKILIPNATSHRNIGDLVMLIVLVDMLKDICKKNEIIIHSNEPELHDQKLAYKIDDTLYYWSVLSTNNNSVRILRLLLLFAYYIFYRIGLKLSIVNIKLKSLVKDYENADLIIFTGGGYLRSKKGLTQSLNLLMQLFMFEFSTLFPSRKIVAPISFGPMAYEWQYKLAALILSKLDLITARESYSYDALIEYGLRNVLLSSDHALLLTNNKKNNTIFSQKNKIILGFTIRNWFNEQDQLIFEEKYAKAISNVAIKRDLIIQPILQVDAPDYRIENDKSATIRIIRRLQKKHLKVSGIKKVENIVNANKIYSSIHLLLGMRMHSNILAALSNTPFIALSYEYKTEGIVAQLGLSKYCIKSTNFDENKLEYLILDGLKNRNKIKVVLKKNLFKIKKRDSDIWRNILRNYLN